MAGFTIIQKIITPILYRNISETKKFGLISSNEFKFSKQTIYSSNPIIVVVS